LIAQKICEGELYRNQYKKKTPFQSFATVKRDRKKAKPQANKPTGEINALAAVAGKHI